jgi:hypothetical protein
MSVITAMPCCYQRCRFRSRLEARYAVLFDHLGIQWQYEPQGWWLPAGFGYLPDFWLPTVRAYFEVKGLWGYSIRKPIALARATKEPLYLAVNGIPSHRQLLSVGWWDADTGTGVTALSPDCDWNTIAPCNTERVLAACAEARSARFEPDPGALPAAA